MPCRLIEEGLESGFRTYQHDNLQTYREMDASLSFEYRNAVLRQNRMWNLRNDLFNDLSKAAEEILLLHRQGKDTVRCRSRVVASSFIVPERNVEKITNEVS